MELPIFPLGTVLLPHMPLPLRVFEPRYLTMLSTILEAEEPAFGIVLIERGQEVGGDDVRMNIGTIAHVVDVGSDETGVLLLVEGRERFVVDEWLEDAPFPHASVTRMPDLVWDEALADRLSDAERLVRRAIANATEWSEQPWSPDVELADEPLAATWQLAGVAPIELVDRVALLHAASTDVLLTALVDFVEDSTPAP